MTNEQASQFVSAIFKEVFTNFDRKKVEKFFSPDLTGFLLNRPLNYDGIIDWVTHFENAYSSLEAMVHKVVVEGNQIAAVVNLSLIEINTENKAYISIAIFLEVSPRGKVTKWRLFSSSI